MNNVPNGKTEYYYENISSERMLDNDVSSSPVFFKSPFFNADRTTNPNAFHIGSNLSYFSFVFFKNELWNQGSLLRTAVYKNGDTPDTFKIIKSTVNKYAILKKSTLPYNIVFNNFSETDQRFPGDYPQSFALPYNQGSDYHSYQFYYGISKTSQGKKVLTQTTETDYDSNEVPTIEKITTYGYENPDHNQVTKTETTNSKDEILRTQLSYPQDLITTGQTAEMQKLVAQNKIDRPIKTETFLNNVQTSESITKYEESTATGNVLLLKEIHSSKGVVETFPFNAANRKINFKLYDSEVVNDVTVGNGNVLEYVLENDTPVAIIWGYNKSQRIAKIENATYSQVTAYVENLQNLSNTGTEADLISALNALRAALPNCMTTTYTYLPLVGVTSITDPKGISTYYEYDSSGRLQYVKDQNLNILQRYCYNYLGQQTDCSLGTSTVTRYKNVFRSSTFTKQSCGAGSVGATYVYSVPAGIYSSILSQADADSQADSEISSNGQNFANINGTCLFSSVSIEGNFTRNNCAAGGVAQVVRYTLPAGSKTSVSSQADADAQATILFNTNGQANANTIGTCTFSSVSMTGNFTKNNCAAGGEGPVASYTLPEGSKTSTSSQADADAQAAILFNTNGQANANTAIICTFYNVEKSKTFRSKICNAGKKTKSKKPEPIKYIVPARKYNSTISQQDADAKAQKDIDRNGQEYANEYGLCL